MNLGYPAANQPVAVGSFSRFKNQIATAVYDYRRDKTYVVFPGGLAQGEGLQGGGQSMAEPDQDVPGNPDQNMPISPNDPYIMAYDHATHSWEPPVKVGDAYYPADYHYYPVVAMSYASNPADDLIQVFQGGHNENYDEQHVLRVHYVKRYWHRAALGIGGVWDSEELQNTGHNTYPAVFKAADGKLYVFFRRTVGGPDPLPEYCDQQPNPRWYEPEDYVVLNSMGVYESQSRLIDPTPYGDDWGTIYVKAMRYTPSFAGIPAGIHMLFGLHYRHSCDMRNEYYAFFALGNGNSYQTANLYAADGQWLAGPGQPVTRAVFDNPLQCPSCLVYSEQVGPYTTRTAIDTWRYYYALGPGLGDALPVIFYNDGGNTQISWKYFDRSIGNWVSCDPLPQAPPGAGVRLPFDVTVGSGGEVNLYFSAYDPGQVHPRVETWRYGNFCHDGTWQQTDVLWGAGEDPGMSWFNFIPQAKPDGSLIATFVEQNFQVPPVAGGKLYGWNNTGVVKASNRGVTTNTPVGMGVVLDVDAQSLDYRQDDNILIPHTSAFNFGTQIAVEAIVRFDGASLPARDEFVLSKHSSVQGPQLFWQGFNLWYDHVSQRLRWNVGYGGLGDLTVPYTGTLAAGQWYYLVGTVNASEQALWANGVKMQPQPLGSYVPNWGTYDLRLGGPATASLASYLDGTLGGYVTLRDTVPTAASIRASYKNLMLDSTTQSFVKFCPAQYWSNPEPTCEDSLAP